MLSYLTVWLLQKIFTVFISKMPVYYGRLAGSSRPCTVLLHHDETVTVILLSVI